MKSAQGWEGCILNALGNGNVFSANVCSAFIVTWTLEIQILSDGFTLYDSNIKIEIMSDDSFGLLH